MKVAIISDTHDNSPAIVWIIEYLNQHNVSTALHAGDIINPGIIKRFIENYQGHLHFVFGNNDGEMALLSQRAAAAENCTCHLDVMKLELEDKKIFMNHYSRVSEAMANSNEFDVCIGGHDHRYRVEKYGETLFINPGNTTTKDKWLPQPADEESSIVILDLKTMDTERVMVPTNAL